MVRKGKRLASLLLIFIVSSHTLSSLAANYKKKPSYTTAPAHYKGEFAKKSARPRSYKGEVPMKPAAPLPPVMAPLVLNTGPYFGIAAGYDSYKIHQNTSFVGTTSSSFNPTINATGFIPAILAGYGYAFNNALYLGLEIFLNYSNAYQSTNYLISDTTDHINYNSKFFVSTGYGINLLPGIRFTDSALAFLRLGYQMARLRGQENLNADGVIQPSNTSSWSGGFSYGLGFEEAMMGNFSLRGEYVHTDYRAFTATSGTLYSPSNNEFLLSLIYHLAY